MGTAPRPRLTRTRHRPESRAVGFAYTASATFPLVTAKPRGLCRAYAGHCERELDGTSRNSTPLTAMAKYLFL